MECDGNSDTSTVVLNDDSMDYIDDSEDDIDDSDEDYESSTASLPVIDVTM